MAPFQEVIRAEEILRYLELLESGSSENLCRTQVKVKLHGSSKAADLLTAPLGNHILLMRGSYTKELMEWWEMFIEN